MTTIERTTTDRIAWYSDLGGLLVSAARRDADRVPR
jgi:hypothetical protein